MTIPVVFSANDYFIPYTSVAVQSIMRHICKNNICHFYVLHKGISGQFIRLLHDQLSQFSNCLVDFIDMTDYISKYDFFVTRHISIETYFRLFIPYIFTDYQKIIYLDGDTLCFTDISELYDTELSDYLLAAVPDIGVSWYYSPKHSGYLSQIYQVLLSLRKPETYFNAGMVVMNVDLFRKTYTLEHLYNFAVSHKFQAHDQDILNTLCEGKVRLLPFSWNLMRTDNFIYLPEQLKNQYIEAENNPRILHFKPWTYGNYSPYLPFSEYFWKYAAQTPFYLSIVSRMKEEGILVTHSIREQIFLDIKNKNNCGIWFIIKCFLIWAVRRFRNNSQ